MRVYLCISGVDCHPYVDSIRIPNFLWVESFDELYCKVSPDSLQVGEGFYPVTDHRTGGEFFEWDSVEMRSLDVANLLNYLKTQYWDWTEFPACLAGKWGSLSAEDIEKEFLVSQPQFLVHKSEPNYSLLQT